MSCGHINQDKLVQCVLPADDGHICHEGACVVLTASGSSAVVIMRWNEMDNRVGFAWCNASFDPGMFHGRVSPWNVLVRDEPMVKPPTVDILEFVRAQHPLAKTADVVRHVMSTWNINKVQAWEILKSLYEDDVVEMRPCGPVEIPAEDVPFCPPGPRHTILGFMRDKRKEVRL